MSPHVVDKLTVRVGRFTKLACAVSGTDGDQLDHFVRSIGDVGRSTAIIGSRRPDDQTAGDRHIHSQRIAGPMEAAPPC